MGRPVRSKVWWVIAIVAAPLWALGGTPARAESAPVPEAAAAAAATPVPALTVCARISDASNVVVPGATVIVIAPDGRVFSATAASDGCAVFPSLPAGSMKVTVASPGTEPVDVVIEIEEAGGARFDASLAPVSAQGEEILITERREAAGETRRTISPQEVQNIPGAANDALKSLQTMPGVARAPFGANMLVVRGAAPGDTRVFLDGQEIPQLYHFGGLTSVFATEAISRIDFLPGGFGVRYGRAIGGVVDVETRGGRKDEWGGLVDADLYDAAALAEGPVGREGRNGRVLAAARRSYVDLVLPAVARGGNLAWTLAPRYYDYQLRYDLPDGTDGTRARLMSYGSDDAMTFVLDKPAADGTRGRYLFRTAFHRLQAPISRPLPNGWLITATPAMGFQRITLDGGGVIALQGTRTSGALRAEGRGPIARRVKLLLGMDGQVQRDAYAVDYADDANTGAASPDRRLVANAAYGSMAAGAYAEAEVDSGGGFTWVPGLRVDAYGPASKFTADPRIAARWRFEKRSWAKAYAGVYHQPPQFNEWDDQLGNPDLRPARAIQAGVGGGHQLTPSLTIEGETFYKWIDDLTVQTTGDPSDPEARTRFANAGIGRAYGLEALVRREMSERVYGWLSYTLSRSERASPYTPGWTTFSMDQTHILAAVGVVKLRRGWTLSGRFRYVTGNPTTVVDEAVYDADRDRYMPVPGFRHDERLPSFHQLDVRLDKRWEWSGWTLDGYLDVQNVYARQNAERVRYDFDYSERAYITGLPVFPSVGVRAEF